MIVVIAVSPTLGGRILSPEGDIELRYERKEEYAIDYEETISDMTFMGDDYRWFHSLETGDNRCQKLTLMVYHCNLVKKNGGDLIHKTTFSMADGKWITDKCTVIFNFKEKGENFYKYKTIDKGNRYNFMSLENPIYTAQFNDEIQYFMVLRYNTTEPATLREWGYKRMYQRENITQHIYGKEVAFCKVGTAPYGDWILDNTEDGVQKPDDTWDKYYRKTTEITDAGEYPVILINNNQIPQLPPDATSDPKTHAMIFLGMAIYPRKLEDVLQYLIDKDDLGLTIKSDFLQINPDVVTDINYVTGEKNVWDRILVVTKDNAEYAYHVQTLYPELGNHYSEASLKNTLEDMCNLMNLRYKIEGNHLLLEHVSYFEGKEGIDLGAIKNKQLLRGRNTYHYISEELPKREKFEIINSRHPDFVGADIWYDSSCVNNRTESDTSYKSQTVSTDIFSILMHRNVDGLPGNKDENDLKDRMVFLAVYDEFGSVYEKASGILSNTVVVNYPFSMSYLHEKLWKHKRVLKNGIMNNTPTSFTSVKPTKEQEKFKTIVRPDEFLLFDPYDKMKTGIGWGTVKNVMYDLTAKVFDVTLIHE